MSQIQVSKTTLLGALITCIIAVFALLAEAFMPEELAKMLTVPALYALVMTSAMTFITTLRRTH
jgi:Fe2+ transport system protein B